VVKKGRASKSLGVWYRMAVNVVQHGTYNIFISSSSHSAKTLLIHRAAPYPTRDNLEPGFEAPTNTAICYRSSGSHPNAVHACLPQLEPHLAPTPPTRTAPSSTYLETEVPLMRTADAQPPHAQRRMQKRSRLGATGQRKWLLSRKHLRVSCSAKYADSQGRTTRYRPSPHM